MSELKLLKNSIDTVRKITQLLEEVETIKFRLQKLENNSLLKCPFCSKANLLLDSINKQPRQMVVNTSRGKNTTNFSRIARIYKCANNNCNKSIEYEELEKHLKLTGQKIN